MCVKSGLCNQKCFLKSSQDTRQHHEFQDIIDIPKLTWKILVVVVSSLETLGSLGFLKKVWKDVDDPSASFLMHRVLSKRLT